MTPGQVPEVRWIGQPRLTLGLDRHQRVGLAAHLACHGPLPRVPRGTLGALAKSADLRGRGGAAFPFARKLQAVHAAARQGRVPTVLVNGMESDPGSAKDRMLLTRVPHLVLDGAELAAADLGAREILVGVPETGPAYASARRALAERPLPLPTRVVPLPERFVAGEGGALVRGANGAAAIPPGRKRRASDSGVDGAPTLLSNAETYAQLALIARLGPGGFRSAGTAAEPGTVLLTVGGAVSRPAVVEAPAGVALSAVLAECGAASVGDGVLVGGYHGAWVAAADADAIPLSRAGLAGARGTLGAGMILVLGDLTCPLGEVARAVGYLARESSGQCGPCFRGLPRLARAVATLAAGRADQATADWLRHAAAEIRGRGACAHPDGTSRFLLSAIDVFAAELDRHVADGGCGREVQGMLPVPAADGGRRLVVDWSRCEGHGLCALVAPELVSPDVDGYPQLADGPVPPWLDRKARKAVTHCPALALRFAR